MKIFLIIKYKGHIICQGRVVDVKTTFNGHVSERKLNLVSMNHQEYINLDYPDIDIIYEDDCETYINLTKIDKTQIDNWKNFNFDNPKLVYIDQNIHNIDNEVKELVQVLNFIPHLKTTGSCSGHGKEKLWVNFVCYDLNVLNKLISLFLFQGRFNNKFTIKTDPTLEWDPNGIHLKLESKQKGKNAYESSKLLAFYIDSIQELFNE